MRTVQLTSTLLAVFLFGLAGSGCSSDSSNSYSMSPTAPTSPTVLPNTVQMSGSAFSPASITVTVGTTITWKNNDGYAHTATSDTGVWDTGNIAAGASATTTFNTPGTFPYHCTYHVAMGMKGTVIVK